MNEIFYPPIWICFVVVFAACAVAMLFYPDNSKSPAFVLLGFAVMIGLVLIQIGLGLWKWKNNDE